MKIYHVISTYVPNESWFVIAKNMAEAIEEVLLFDMSLDPETVYVTSMVEVFDTSENCIVGHVEY